MPAIYVVIYARYSSSSQRMESIDSQLRICREHAAKKGYIVVAEYCDAAVTGTNDQRDNFQLMVEQILSGRLQCDIVLAWKYDRLWRDSDAPGYFKYLLRQRNVTVESVHLQLDRTNPYSVILEALDHGQAAAYSINLAIEVTRGLTQNARQAQSTGGRPPLGYTIDQHGQYQIDPRGAEAIQMIFAHAATGASYRDIIAECNTRGYRTTAGREFGPNTINELLGNRKYVGVYEYRVWRAENKRKRATGHMFDHAEEIIEVPGGVPAIIAQETWDAVQERLAVRKGRRSGGKMHAKTIYLLTGHIYCGLCGSRMTGDARSNAKKRYTYYTCLRSKGNKDGERCPLPSMPQPWAEGEVLTTLREVIFGAEQEPKILAQLRRWRAERDKGQVTRSASVKAQLASVEKELGNMISAIAAGVPASGMMGERMRALEAERATLQASLAAVLAGESPRAEDDLREYLQAARATLSVGGDATRQRAIIQQFIEAVVVYPDYLDIMAAIDFTGEKNTVSGNIRRREKPEECGSDICRWTGASCSHIKDGHLLVVVRRNRP
jgi:site-specific DNA recombinase